MIEDEHYLEIIRTGSEGWNRFKSGKNNQELVLKHADFSGQLLKGYDFSRMTFEKCDFSNAQLDSCDFSEGKLFDNNLASSILNNCPFFEASFTCSTLSYSRVRNCKFTRADLIGVEWQESKISCCDFRLARIHDVDFSNSLMESCKVYGSSVWSSNCTLTKESSLIITPDYENPIVTRDLELSHYIYLMHKKGSINMHTIKMFDPQLFDHEFKYNLFISHASEDKPDFVGPLAETLRGMGLEVWYDEFVLTAGDSLRSKIDEGLTQSVFGIVVLSRDFFKKKWPVAELNAIFSLDLYRGKFLIPIWYNITLDEVLHFSPLLADRLSIVNKGDINAVAVDILKLYKKVSNQ